MSYPPEELSGATHWKKYDISLNLRTNWDQLKPDLEGKIRASVGNQDNFLLNYPVHLLDDEMKNPSPPSLLPGIMSCPPKEL